ETLDPGALARCEARPATGETDHTGGEQHQYHPTQNLMRGNHDGHCGWPNATRQVRCGGERLQHFPRRPDSSRSALPAVSPSVPSMAKKSKNTFNVAVFGAGAIGLDHIQSFQLHPSARVVALAETSPERGREAADRFNIPELVTDYRDLLARDDIDVVSIALPNYLHAPVALASLRARKHVMLDKPMATNAADAARLVNEARKQGVTLMVGQNNRFNPEVQTAKQLIEDGVLGEVYHAKTAWTRRAGIPRIGSWFTQTQFAGGGCTYDIGVHALDRCLHLM